MGFIAAPQLRGLDVDAGLIINALAATGAFAAAAAAVWVATWDRRERTQEREAADEAQAGLVVVQPGWVTSPAALVAVIQNFGTLPVLNVSLVRLDVIGQPHLDVTRGRSRVRAVLEPRRDDQRGAVFECAPPKNDPRDAYAIALNGDMDFRGAPYREGVSDIAENAAQRRPSIDHNTMLRATVWFEDSKGNPWETVFESRAGAVRIRQDSEVWEPRRVSLVRR